LLVYLYQMAFINYLSDIICLRNNYFAVRHGESEANIAHIISSNPQIGIESHGLSANGRSQVAENAQTFLRNNSSNTSYIIISSDFRRARETAEILALNLGKSKDDKLSVQFDKRLRERFFGIYDGTSDDNYNIIWQNDQDNLIKNTTDQVESVESVRERTTALIKGLEEKYDNKTIFLVSHGDSLQILQTAFGRMPNANKQRDLKHLERGEFRELILK
jgi:broad specificity phosphatase PhoE